MRDVIDKFLKEKVREFVDYKKYVLDNLNPQSIESFSELVKNFPLNYMSLYGCEDILDNMRITKDERLELRRYADDEIDKIKYLDYAKRDEAFDMVDDAFNKYLYSIFKYNGKNKKEIFNNVTCMLDYDLGYEDVYKQFNEIQYYLLKILELVK